MSKRKFRPSNGHRTKRRFKPVITGILIFVVAALTFGCVGACIANLKKNELNPDNLLKRDMYYENLVTDFEKGLNVTWRDDGSFYLTGKYNDDNMANNAHYEYSFATVTLEPGTYTLSSGSEKDSEDTAYIFAKYNNTTVSTMDKGECRIEITDPTTVIIGFAVKNNVRFIYREFNPTLANGEVAVPLYVESK